MPSAIRSFRRPNDLPSLRLLASMTCSGATIMTRVSSAQLWKCHRPGSVQVRCTAYTLPWLSIDTAPGPCMSLRNVCSWLLASSFLMESDCS